MEVPSHKKNHVAEEEREEGDDLSAGPSPTVERTETRRRGIGCEDDDTWTRGEQAREEWRSRTNSPLREVSFLGRLEGGCH